MTVKYETASKKSARRTDLKHREKISGLTGLNRRKLNKFFPRPADRRKLAKLIQIVEDATAKNRKISALSRFGRTGLAKTALALVKYLKNI